MSVKEVNTDGTCTKKTVNEIAMEGLVKALHENVNNYYARVQILEQIGKITKDEKRKQDAEEDPFSFDTSGIQMPKINSWLWIIAGGAAGAIKLIQWYRRRRA
jgi:hypothetical protein